MFQKIILIFIIFNFNPVFAQINTEPNGNNNLINSGLLLKLPFTALRSYEQRERAVPVDKKPESGREPEADPQAAPKHDPPEPSSEESPEYIITTNTPLFSTNKIIITNIKSSFMINLGFFFMLESEKFSDKFSQGTFGDDKKPYYHFPFNSWNDNLYIVISLDWKFSLLDIEHLRWGWSLGINLAGSGGKENSIFVTPDSDLGIAKGGTKGFYAIYNNLKFPLMLNLRFHPIDRDEFKFYLGGGAGVCFHFITYNELMQPDRIKNDEKYEKTFIPIMPIFKIFLGISFTTIEMFGEMFLEVNYKFTENPIVTNEYLDPGRSVTFQASGLSLGFGFRY